MSKNRYKKIVLAYSGGLDTSVILAWLKETYQCEVIAFCADIGQAEETEGLAEKARQSGATDFVLRDLREEFARDFCFPMLRANAAYEGDYLMGTSIARPLIAKGMMDVVRDFGADTISHGATGKGNDQVRFELTAMAIDPNIKIIAPGESGISGRVRIVLPMPRNAESPWLRPKKSPIRWIVIFFTLVMRAVF